MADQYTATRFTGTGPFVLPPAGPIKFVQTASPDEFLLEWPLPQAPGQTQRLVQLPVSPAIAMALMLLLQKAQEHFDLPIPKVQISGRRFQ